MAFNFSHRIQKIIQFDARKATIEIINENAEFLSDLLRSQLRVGKDGNGNAVTVFLNPNYHPRTVFNKLENGFGDGREVRWITNYMTGDFYASIRPITNGNVMTFTSDVPYFPSIIQQSTRIIMKLNSFNLERFKKEILIPQLKQRQHNGI